MDGPPVSGSEVGAAALASLLERPMTPPDPATVAAIESGPIDSERALRLSDLDRLLDPAPLLAENGWCELPDGVRYVAVRTAMPSVRPEMVDWWFDWHPREPLRYRIWHPEAHRGNRLEEPPWPQAKPFWGAIHHPVEDLGQGLVHSRIAFVSPTEIGFSTDARRDPRVGTVVCGWVGDDCRRTRHSVMTHVFLWEGEGLVLRSRFWLGAAIRPYLPAPLAAPAASLLNRPALRRRLLPRDVAPALALHCAAEFANLAALLPELYGSFGGPIGSVGAQPR